MIIAQRRKKDSALRCWSHGQELARKGPRVRFAGTYIREQPRKGRGELKHPYPVHLLLAPWDAVRALGAADLEDRLVAMIIGQRRSAMGEESQDEQQAQRSQPETPPSSSLF